MTATAAHLIDKVIPSVPIRQFVFTVPYWLRFKMAWDSKLFSEVHKVFTNTMRAWLRQRARDMGFDDAEVGGTAHTHRFGDGLKISPHIHALYADGVWCAESGESGDTTPRFIYLPEPTDDEIADLVRSLHHKVIRRLMRIGVIRGTGQPTRQLTDETALKSREVSSGAIRWPE